MQLLYPYQACCYLCGVARHCLLQYISLDVYLLPLLLIANYGLSGKDPSASTLQKGRDQICQAYTPRYVMCVLCNDKLLQYYFAYHCM